LSYTTFKFDNLRVEPSKIVVGGSANVTVDITNTGTREGDEVPQLYVHQRIASVTRPIMQLQAFRRITLKPGEKRTVEFTVAPAMLSMLDMDMHKVVEPGIFDIMVGPSSDQTSTVKLAVTGVHGETGLPLLPPPPKGSESGVVSTFDDLKVSANYGTWVGGSDAMNGGKSTISIAPVEHGANGTKGALRISGELIAGAGFLWAGALFSPGAVAGGQTEPANLSGKKMVSFWAKGDGSSYVFAMTSAGTEGGMPKMQFFTAGPEWKQYSFPISAFGTDGSDVNTLIFARGQSPGKFEFELDEVEIR
jgi:Fibronectin type III-like domain/Complex I intermediate-associated protein 30 (CIA30)